MREPAIMDRLETNRLNSATNYSRTQCANQPNFSFFVL